MAGRPGQPAPRTARTRVWPPRHAVRPAEDRAVVLPSRARDLPLQNLGFAVRPQQGGGLRAEVDPTLASPGLGPALAQLVARLQQGGIFHPLIQYRQRPVNLIAPSPRDERPPTQGFPLSLRDDPVGRTHDLVELTLDIL